MRTNDHTPRTDRHDPHLYEEVALEELPLSEASLSDGSFADGPLDAIALDEADGPVLHRDLGDIAVTASSIEGDPLADITINRTKGGTSPFVPIVKTPTYAENSGNLTGYAVEIEDAAAETGYRHLGNVSAGYLLLPNDEVRALALEVAVRSGLPFKESRIFWDGARFAHVVDFLETEEVAPGDEVGLSLVTRSSYDRSWRYECALMGKRFVCDNGALSGEFFARVAFRHTSAAAYEAGGWKDVVREGLALVDRAPEDLHRFAGGLRALKRAAMTDARLRAAWRLFPSLGESTKGQVVSRYVAHEEPTLFGLFNAGTHVLWHRERMTAADFAHNEAFTGGLLRYAAEHLN